MLSIGNAWCLFYFVYSFSNDSILCILDDLEHEVTNGNIDIRQIWVDKWGKGRQRPSHPQRSEWTSLILSSVAPSATMEQVLNVVCKLWSLTLVSLWYINVPRLMSFTSLPEPYIISCSHLSPCFWRNFPFYWVLSLLFCIICLDRLQHMKFKKSCKVTA